MRTCVSNYHLKTTKLTDIKIVHISDIHFDISYNFKILKKVSKKIEILKPNYICVTGDILDNNRVLDNEEAYKKLSEFFVKLCQVCKVIVILGNHEMKGKKYTITNYNSILKKLKKIPNLIVLDNEVYIDNNICFTAFNPSYEYYELKGRDYKLLIRDFDKLNLRLDLNKYNILLIHTPKDLLSDNIYNHLKDFELILSGHTHGGMVPIKLRGNNGIISPGKRLFPKNVRGYMKRGNTNLIVCSGIVRLSNCTKILRHFNFVYASHIVNINITK